ncbi:MAG: Enoyl-CoA hydratase [Ilumatobacteraceae bacterium]|jgi:enoyl-CoA hydratase|nr:Enoyl-CoA hydratase [Ilumatobacteraceae bacterium]
MSQDFETLTVERHGPIARITLDRPELMNRVDAIAHTELVRVFRQFEDPGEVRAIVFAANGRVFSAGGDFELMLAGNAELATRTRMADEGFALIQSLLEVKVPIVVALHGDAIGLGATLVLTCDAVVSHPAARIADPHVNIGLVAGDGGCLAWPESIGMLRAKRHLLTGDALTGAEGYRIGLVSDLVDGPDDVLPAALALAEQIAALPPLAVQGTKRTLNAVLRHRFAEVMAIGLAHEVSTLGSADLREAIAAFKERRPPVYAGR